MSCSKTENLFQGDGSTQQFSFTFTYMSESEVNASLLDPTTGLFVLQDRDTWSLSNATTVLFDTAPPGGGGVSNVKIFRNTNIDSLDAEFFSGSAIRAQDLNNNFEQLQQKIQENTCTEEHINADIIDIGDVIINITDAIDDIDGELTDLGEQVQANTEAIAAWEPYELPIASANTLGGIRVGANLTISAEGVLSSTGGGGSSTITFKGTANFTATAPAGPAVGDLWINTTAGTGAWAGFVGDAVGVNDRAFFNGTDWDLLPIGAGDIGVVSVVAGDNIVVNSTDPANPVVSAPDALTEAEADAAYMPLNISTLPALPTP